MFTVLAKDKVLLDGKVVRLRRTKYEKYRGGKMYIRAFLNDLGRFGYNILRIDGKPFRCKEKCWGYRRPMKISTLGINERDNWFLKCERRRDYYLSDLGINPEGPQYGTVYEFDNKTLRVLELLEQTQDEEKSLRLIKGVLDPELIKEEINSFAWEREMEDNLYSDPYYGD